MSGSGLQLLSNITSCTIEAIGQGEDKCKKQVIWHVVRKSNEKNSLYLLETTADGTMKVKAINNYQVLLSATNTLTKEAVSDVAIASGCKVGSVKGMVRLTRQDGSVFCNIYSSNECGTEQCYFVRQVSKDPTPLTKISAVPSHKFVLLQFAVAKSLDIDAKAMLLCFANKVYFNTYFNIKYLKCINNDQCSIMHAIAESDKSPKLALVLNWQDPTELPCNLFQAPASTGAPSPLHNVVFRKVAKMPGDHHIFSVTSAVDGSLSLIIDGTGKPKNEAEAIDVCTSKTILHVEKIFQMDCITQIAYNQEPGSGYFLKTQIMSSQISMDVEFEEPLNVAKDGGCLIYDGTQVQSSLAIAYISVDRAKKQLKVSMAQSVGKDQRHFILAYAIKVMFAIYKLHVGDAPEVKSVKEAITKIKGCK